MNREAFADKVAIVTGAGSGIGAALCAALVERGATVVATDLRGTSIQLDVRDPVAFSAAIDAVKAEHGRVDYLFNNAGILSVGEIRDLDISSWRNIIETNLFGAINGTSAAYRVMAAQGFGHIVNVASAAALIPSPLYAPYAASKAAVVALSQALRLEAKPLGVYVSIVCPGNVATGIFDSSEIVNPERSDVFKDSPIGKVSADSASATILRGVERRMEFIVFPLSMRAMWWATRLHPRALDRLLSEVVRRFRLTRSAER